MSEQTRKNGGAALCQSQPIKFLLGLKKSFFRITIFIHLSTSFYHTPKVPPLASFCRNCFARFASLLSLLLLCRPLPLCRPCPLPLLPSLPLCRFCRPCPLPLCRSCSFAAVLSVFCLMILTAVPPKTCHCLYCLAAAVPAVPPAEPSAFLRAALSRPSFIFVVCFRLPTPCCPFSTTCYLEPPVPFE